MQNILCDVANQGALWNNPAAHDYARLYFRPKNRFHLKTEGIKSTTDPYRIDPHMAVPVMFVFDFVSVMTLDDSYFVAGNFASQAIPALQGDRHFDSLRFDYIYHDSAVSPETMQTIQDARMAEVVIDEYLSLESHLVAVLCRTIHEERMLRYYLNGVDISGIRIVVEKGGSIFFRRGIYLTELYTIDGVLHFEFTAPTTAQKQTYSVRIVCGDRVLKADLAAKRWRLPQIVNADPDAEWRVEIEECLAYLGPVPSNVPLVL